jgi:hypothetical protein
MSNKQNGTPMTVYEKVHSFPTKHQEGFIQAEIDELLKQFYDVRKWINSTMQCGGILASLEMGK